MPDAIFDHPRLAELYDALDPDRSDLDHYVAIADELGATRVLDVGCGTGCLAVRLAERGLDVTGVDPAAASLTVARRKQFAGDVRWIHGDATATPEDTVADVALMTGNVAQVFTDEADWADTLRAIQRHLRPGGHLAFETRVPERRAWEGWTRGATIHRAHVPEIGTVEAWVQVTDVSPPFVTFQSPHRFVDTGETIDSTSTLIFRDRVTIEADLSAAGFDVIEVRDAPDRPNLEWVFVARRR